MQENKTTRIARTATIAALYASFSLICLLFMGNLSWGPVQLRLSEAICVLALFTPDAIVGLGLGCAIANLANIALSGTGLLGMLDVIFGSCATVVGAALSWRLRAHPRVAVAGPVISNALIIPLYLPLLLKGLGFYTIPFTSIALDSSYPLMVAFGVVATGIGEAIVLYALGLPLYHALSRTPLARRLTGMGRSSAVMQ
jgi:uncharacterized membrane protein